MTTDRQPPPFPMLTAIFIGVILWALLIAAGVYNRSGGNVAKTSIVIAVAAMFLSGWSVVLRRRREK